ncbi:MAG: hypothetical protein ACFUZC_08385 [Chthoniobacteraceae bacterium]
MKPSSSVLLTKPAAKGSSLVITLAFLGILTILVVCINEIVRMDRTSSNLYAERAAAEMLSQDAVEELVAKLQQGTSDINRYWLSQPGQIVVGAPQDDPSTSDVDERKILTGAKTPEEIETLSTSGDTGTQYYPRMIYLYSGSATTLSFKDDFLNPPNLNVTTFQDPSTFLITDRTSTSGTAAQMQVRWKYVRKDGSVFPYEPNDPDHPLDLTSGSNPIIGRYAYWADDESSKVNYNLAWKRDSSLPQGHPSQIALTALDVFSGSVSLADTLHQFVTTNNYADINQHLFNSPSDARQVSLNIADALKKNKFEVTHYNHDPDTTFFNEQRIVLTTKKSRANGRPFLDILLDDSKDPGAVANLSQSKLNQTLFGSTTATASNPISPGLIFYLSRTDWPMVTGSGSFQSKYFGKNQDNKPQLVELALNIIDYVRSAESNMSIVEPIRGILKNGVFLGDWLNANAIYRGEESTFKGQTRAPLITKMGLNISTNANGQGKFFIEIYLPKSYGIPSVDLVNDFRYIFQVSDGSAFLVDNKDTPFGITVSKNIWSKDGNSSAFLTAGNRAVISQTFFFTVPAAGKQVTLRAGITRKTASTVPNTRTYPVLEIVPIGDPLVVPTGDDGIPASALFTILPHTTVGAETVPGNPPSEALQTDDPRVSGIAKDWKQKSASWGDENPTAQVDSSIVPQQDTDNTGSISKSSLYMPTQPGSSSNLLGLVSSAGELGYIHTGIQVTSSKDAGISWRTIRLQPNRQSADIVPDWALMDLFTVPANVTTSGTICDAAKAVFLPHSSGTFSSSVGGRININAFAEPRDSSNNSFGGQRTIPLQAALLGAVKISSSSVPLTLSESGTLALNIYNRILAASTRGTGKLYGYADGFYSPGEIVEIKGIADGGEDSEELVRQIGNLVTTRGNVFSIYTIAQALKQTPQGKLVVTAENRQQAMIERYIDPSTKIIRFKTIYSRPLTP